MKSDLELVLRESEKRIDDILHVKLRDWTQQNTDAVVEGLNDVENMSERTAHAIRLSADLVFSNYKTLFQTFALSDALHTCVKTQFGSDIHSFFNHDGAHIGEYFFMASNSLCWLSRRLRAQSPQHLLRIVQNMQQMTETMRSAYTHPWRLLRYMAKNKLELPQQYESLDLKAQTYTIASTLEERFSVEVSGDITHTSAMKKSIIITGDAQPILADQGLIWSVVYNNLKNTQKKFEEEEQRMSTEETHQKYIASLPAERVSHVHIAQLNEKYISVTFTDSGKGIDINKMLERLAERMEKETLLWPNEGMEARLKRWQKNDYGFLSITMEDATNAAFMAHLSGEQSASFTSGMGLYGTKLIVEQLGGALIYTTTFKGQHPVFTYILPVQPQKDNSVARSLRNKLIAA
jgi:hypothetical protein